MTRFSVRKVATGLRSRSARFLIALILGATQAWATRFDMSPDGISYLNLSDYYMEGDYWHAVNGYWSPLYPWLIALQRVGLGVSAHWEAPLVHLTNFVCFLISFATFELLISEILRSLKDNSVERYADSARIFGLAVFLWSALLLIGLGLPTPDQLVAAIAFGIGALLLRCVRRPPSLYAYIALGALAGVGYLAKAVMFPAALIALFTGLLIAVLNRLSPRYVIASTIAFAFVAAPQVAAVSLKLRKLTFAETGRIGYGMTVSGYSYLWAEKTPKNTGIAEHPVTKLSEHPPVFEFVTDWRHTTYPLWDDPSYFQAGMRPHFSARRQAEVTGNILGLYLRLAWKLMLVAIAVAVFCSPRLPFASWPVFLFGSGLLGLYALIYSNSRHLGPWLALTFIALILGFRISSRETGFRRMRILLTCASLALCIPLSREGYRDVAAIARDDGGFSSQSWLVADELSRLGLKRGQRVATVGGAFDAYWARLSGVQISAEISANDAASYWSASPPERALADRALGASGRTFAVAKDVPTAANLSGWLPVGKTGYFVLPLRAAP